MLSKKQIDLLKWPYTGHTALICDGAVRSGKTSIMSLSFILWSMGNFNNCNFGVSGKTVGSAERNIIQPLLGITYLRQHFNMAYSRSTHQLLVSRGDRTNRFYVFGGRDESSYMLIQGVTLAGIMLDEAALMPRSFVEQAMARCSVAGRKIWFNCNPEGPEHWFYKEWILKADEKDATRMHFTMDDNPSLDPEIIDGYKMLYSGVFYDRYIRGLWVKAEGLIYPMFDKDRHIVPTVNRTYERYIVSMDYGIQNPTAMLLWGLCEGVWYAVKEYYHSGRETGLQKTDQEYYDALCDLVDGTRIDYLIVDPSASSFIALVHQRGKFVVRRAVNDVIDGIQKTASALMTGKIVYNDCCTRSIGEYGLYAWDEKAIGDRPIKENDHAMDATRYFVNTARLWKEARQKRTDGGLSL